MLRGRIEYNEPTYEDHRKRAGFWLACGQFLATAFVAYVGGGIIILLAFIILIIKLINTV